MDGKKYWTAVNKPLYSRVYRNVKFTYKNASAHLFSSSTYTII